MISPVQKLHPHLDSRPPSSILSESAQGLEPQPSDIMVSCKVGQSLRCKFGNESFVHARFSLPFHSFPSQKRFILADASAPPVAPLPIYPRDPLFYARRANWSARDEPVSVWPHRCGPFSSGSAGSKARDSEAFWVPQGKQRTGIYISRGRWPRRASTGCSPLPVPRADQLPYLKRRLLPHQMRLVRKADDRSFLGSPTVV